MNTPRSSTHAACTVATSIPHRLQPRQSLKPCPGQGSGIAWFIMILVVVALLPLPSLASTLCSSNGNNQSYEWMTRFQINGATTPTYGVGGYFDNSASAMTTLTAGNAYAVEADVRTNGTTYMEYVVVWLDMNQDGAIDNATERVYAQNQNVTTFLKFTGNTMTIPISAHNGEMVGRVIMQYSASPVLCGSYTYGTTIDFKVNIIGGTQYYNLTTLTAGSGTGTVTKNPSASSYLPGTVVTVTANPTGSNTFTGWSGDLSGATNPTTITMDADKSVTATFSAGPAAPSNPGATSLTASSITWTWQDNASDETGFKVWADAGAAAPTTQRTTTAAGVQQWLYGSLAPNAQYSFQVAATNALGTSAKSANFSAWTLANAPGTPTLSAVSANTLAVTIAANGNPAATEYAIYCYRPSGSWVQDNGTLGASATWHTKAYWDARTIIGLVANTSHYVEVKARNGAAALLETGLVSSAAVCTLAAAPLAPAMNNPTQTTLAVAIAAGDGNPTATEYAIRITPAVSGNSWVQADGTAGSATVWQTAAVWGAKTITGLTSGSAYSFAAKARNSDLVETGLGQEVTGGTLCNVTFTAGTNGSLNDGSPQPQTVSFGGTCSAVTATPDTGYHLTEWRDDNGVRLGVGGESTLTLANVTRNLTATANFEINLYTVSFASGGHGTLTGNLTQFVNHGSDCTTAIAATPNVDYHFVNWTGTGGFVASTANPLRPTGVTGAMSLTANFMLDPPEITSSGTVAAILGTPFAYQITADHSPTSFNTSALPSGLTVNPATGLISGLPGVTGNFSITLDAVNAGGTGTKTLNLNITAAQIEVDQAFAAGTAGLGSWRFKIIQQGLDAVSANGTVRVAPGTYAENVTITKALTLTSTGAAIAGGSGTALTVNAQNVSITGFVLRDSAVGLAVLAGASGQARGNAISDNTTGLSLAAGASFDTIGNWWGDASGPQPVGLGNPVSGAGAAFTPWLTNWNWTAVPVNQTAAVAEARPAADLSAKVNTNSVPGGSALLLAAYSGNPGDAFVPICNWSAPYFITYADQSTALTQVVLYFYYPAAVTLNPEDNPICWLDPRDGDWKLCSDQVVVPGAVSGCPAYGGYVAVTVTDGTWPGLDALSATAFAAGQPAAPPPSLTSVIPASGAAGTSIQTTLSGNGFVAGLTAELTRAGYAGINGRVGTVTNTTAAVIFDLPATMEPGAWRVRVNNPGSASTDNLTFAVYWLPQVKCISPGTGLNSGTAIIEIFGSYFNSLCTAQLTGPATINSTLVTYVAADHIFVVFNLTGQPAGAYTVTVANPDARSGSLLNAFRIIAAVSNPSVGTIDIISVTKNTSRLLTVNGSNFDSAIQVRLVQGTKYICPTKVTWVNAGQIKLTFTFKIPAGSTTGAWKLNLKNPAGNWTDTGRTITINP